MKTIIGLVILLSISTAAEARFDCGRVQARYFGVGSALALDWARDFQHVAAQVGAVVVQWRNGRDSAGHRGGHVSRIVQLTGQCRALVADDRGTYERDICSRLVAYVLPSAGPRTAASASPRSRHAGRTQVAAYAPADRFTPQ